MPTTRPRRPLRRPRFLSAWLVVVAALAAFGLARAQEIAVVHSFTASLSSATDGILPNASLVQDSEGNLYGTTSSGGSFTHGTLYKVTPDGTVTVLHSFGASATDGVSPSGNLILARDGFLYGTTASGGTAHYGTVYKSTTTGALSIVHQFAPSNTGGQPLDLTLGVVPEAGVIQGADGNLYGTASQGGDFNLGVVFRIKPDGTYTVIHDFEPAGDAASPYLGLVQDAQGTLYGATAQGGTAGMGAIYRIDAQHIYSVIYSFAAATSSYTFTLGSSYTASSASGFSPNSPLAVDAGGNLYGTAAGSVLGGGAIYRLTPQGVFAVLHHFGDGSVAGDGAEFPLPPANTAASVLPHVADRLAVAPDGTVSGVTALGGVAHQGTLFTLSPAGQLTIIHAFGDGTVAKDGASPVGMITGSDGNYYGTTGLGGANGTGSLFKVITALPGFTSPLRVAATLGAAFTYKMTAAPGPVTFAVSGLPSGFTFNGTNTISARPGVTGTITVTLTATNAAGSNSVPLTIAVLSPPVISSLLDVVGSTSSLIYQIRATQSPTSFAATGLPPGVVVNPATGVFIGTATTPGTYPITVSATNAVGTGTAALSLQILSSTPTADEEYLQIHSLGTGRIAGEGSFPGAMTLGVDGTLFGVTAQGGSSGCGTVFNLMPSGVTHVLATFNGVNGSSPQGVIQMADGTLYGTTQAGGSANLGTIFKLTPDGTLSVLHNFGDGSVTHDGANPQAGLLLASDGNFYGTTQNGGSASKGTVFQMTPAGGVTTIHSFGDGSTPGDGAQPVAALVQGIATDTSPAATSGIVLLGTTLLGGAQDEGTLFAITNRGAVTILHSFDDPTVINDGWLPHAPVTISTSGIFGRLIYGTTTTGGSKGKGTIFAFGPIASQGVTILHSFGDGTVINDGANPISPLVVASSAALSTGTTFYGTTQGGGVAGQGTLFTCAMTGTTVNLTGTVGILHSFGDNGFAGDGTLPLGGLCVGADGNLYGTTIGGGNGSGTAFGLQLKQSGPLAVLGGWVCTGPIPAGMTFDSTTGMLSGTPLNSAPAGNYLLTISNYASGAVQSTQTIAFKLNQTFSAWESLHAVTSLVQNGSPSASTSDGVPIALKYLFNIAPDLPMTMADHAAMPTLGVDTTLVPGTPYVALMYRQYVGMTGMDVTLESSEDLVHWAPVDADKVISKQIGPDTATGDLMMEKAAPMSSAPQQFLRLKVTPL